MFYVGICCVFLIETFCLAYLIDVDDLYSLECRAVLKIYDLSNTKCHDNVLRVELK